jgi:hypothetical protein
VFLRTGSKGDLVRKLQSALTEAGLDPGPVDGIFGDKTRKAVVKFQEQKNLEADGLVGPLTLQALDIKAELPKPEVERAQFLALLAKNPNYFGNLKFSPFVPVKEMAGNTSYEELICIGYNPPLERLEAVVHIKREYGFSGDICSAGSPEYVRFYVDWKNDGHWVDVGMKSFTAYDIPGDKPLEYDVTLPLSPDKKHCTIENLPKVRAILSWNASPPPDDPDHVPPWGNVRDATIQIQDFQFLPIGKLLEMAKPGLPDDLLATLDLAQPVALLEPQDASLAELTAMYKGKAVPAHRFGFTKIQQLLAKPSMIGELAKPGFTSVFKELGLDVAELIDNLLATDGDMRYEELKCVGFNPTESALVGVITVKLPYGYSGDLCKKGSYQYVAFWEWDEIEATWLYLGTSAVNVHDLKSIPNAGVQYSVFLPVDFIHRRRPCRKGASVVRIRAILSWQTPPPPSDPNWRPTWGNREETHIHIKPGPHIGPSDQIPYFENIGNMAVCDIKQTSGLATGVGVGAAFPANESPFGGTVTITGFITNPPDVMEGAAPLRYKVFVRPYEPMKTDLENPWQPLANTFTVSVTEQIDANPPVQSDREQKIDADGYYTYLEDLNEPKWRYVADRVLAKWVTGAPMSGRWELRLEAKKPDGTVVPGGAIICTDGSTRSIVRVRLDNAAPFADITITGYKRDPDPLIHPAEECGKFMIGDIIYGKYTVTDEHFRVLSLSVHPDPNPSLPEATKPKPNPLGLTSYAAGVPTGGVVGHDWQLDTKQMRACGYTVQLWTADRTIVNSGSIGWENGDYTGFCLEAAPEKTKKSAK